ncbi:MAG: response regulator [Betaproteobacteria bacterium]
MQLVLDREVPGHSALVIDPNPTSRSVLLAQLREFGFGTVKATARVIDARELIEHWRFNVIVCDAADDGSDSKGQELLEELRRERLLPYSAVFVMITPQATYSAVADAAEAALDSFMLKPFSANALFERLREARQRKRVLQDIFEAMEAKDYERAANLCLERFNQRELYWLYAARIGAELLLMLGRNAEAKGLYDAVIAAKTLPWAKLGVARAQLANGDVAQARRTLEALIDSDPQFSDSYDVLGKVHMEQGNLSEALATYRTAAEMTPGCVLRLQHAGTLSFYAGDARGATQLLERTWQLGRKSRLFDVLSMMLLALLRFDAGDTKGLDAACDVLVDFSARYPQSVRLKRMVQLGEVLSRLNRGRVEEAVTLLRRETEAFMRPDFELETAANLISMWSRLLRFGLGTNEIDGVIKQLARRFAVSRTTCEVLVAASRHHPDAAGIVREAYTEVMKLAEQSMNLAVQDQPRKAVEALLHHGSTTGNAKLIEMALLVAKRHQDNIADAEALLTQQSQLSHRFCAPATHIAGVRRSNRSAGGMVLRR